MARHDAASNDCGGSGDHLPDEVVADLVASDRRRHALACLVEADEPTPVTDLARCVAARERGENRGDVDASVVDAVRDEIFSEHLPKLTATNVVAFDSLVGTVELATDDERLRDPPEAV